MAKRNLSHFFVSFIMWMILVTLASALSIASVAAYFSIVGLATLFSATFLPVVIMASTLEVGKLVATSWIYQTWGYSPRLMKGLLIPMIGVLMLVTSMGIFGFLSKGYLDVKHPTTQQQIVIQSAQDDTSLIRERLASLDLENQAYRLELDQIRAVIESYPKNYVTKKLEAYRANKPRMDEINKGLEENRKLRGELLKQLRNKSLEISKLESEMVTIEGDLGPIKYVAQALGVDIDKGVRFVILAIIFVFDPLAVLLILAANISIKRRYGEMKPLPVIFSELEAKREPQKIKEEIAETPIAKLKREVKKGIHWPNEGVRKKGV